MRLTLRTLLAYMDGFLEGKESEEIGRKIEESKFATDLLHRLRDVMRRLRLGAPSVTERGANLDCNSVAEYLDNVLPADRVPEFEEVCLKSEMHLAEVASAHQILTMVLGEPAEIEPESRQRMYQLPEVAARADEERLAAAEAAKGLSGDGSSPALPHDVHAGLPAPGTVRPKPVVPEYLREKPRRHLLPAAAAMFLLGAAAMLVLLVTGQLDRGKPLGEFIYKLQARFSHNQVAEQQHNEGDRAGSLPSDAPAKTSGDAAPNVTKAADAKPSESAASTGPAGGGGTAPRRDTGALPAPMPIAPEEHLPPPEPVPVKPERNPDKAPEALRPFPEAPPEAAGPATVERTPPAEGSGGVAPATPPGNPIIAAANPPKAEIKTVAPEKPAISPAPSPHVLPPPPKPLPPDDGTAARPVKPTEVARVDTLPKPRPEAPGPAGGADAGPPPKGGTPAGGKDKSKVARFTSDGQDVLLRFDAAASQWRRVLPEDFLAANQAIMALPGYRSRIDVLDVGATLELQNATRVEIVKGGPQGPAGVEIAYGRVVVRPFAQAGTRLRVVAGSHDGTLTLANVESAVGLEVTRVHEPGANPEKSLSHAVTKLYVARGSASWQEGENAAVQLIAPVELPLEGAKADAAPAPVADMPKWIATNTASELDESAGLVVSKALPAERSATLGLTELTEDRRKEVRYLAARCLGYLGQFESLTAALNDVDCRREWPDYFEQLTEAIVRGPEAAAGIRQSLEKQFPNEAAELYRLLWGYSDKNLEAGEDARLVRYLDHDALIFRVLAYANLKEITGRSYFYRPEYTAAKRMQAVQRWRQDQQLGRIRHASIEAKPRAGKPASPPSPAPPPPKPAEDAPARDVRPASAIEPFSSPATRPRVVVPEP